MTSDRAVPFAYLPFVVDDCSARADDDIAPGVLRR